MNRLKKFIIATFIVLFICQNFLSAEEKWPDSFEKIKFYQKGNEIEIENFFENNTIKSCFNRGYKGIRGDYSNINEKYGKKITEKLKENLTEILSGVCTQLDTCKVLNDLFGDQVEKKLNSFPTTIYFESNLPFPGTINSKGTILIANYLYNFMYNAGKKFREKEKYPTKKIDLTLEDFNTRDGVPESIPIQKTIGHEMIHHLTGLGDGMLSECIVHCLTKKCLDPNHDLRDYNYDPGLGQDPLPLEM